MWACMCMCVSLWGMEGWGVGMCMLAWLLHLRVAHLSRRSTQEMTSSPYLAPSWTHYRRECNNETCLEEMITDESKNISCSRNFRVLEEHCSKSFLHVDLSLWMCTLHSTSLKLWGMKVKGQWATVKWCVCVHAHIHISCACHVLQFSM